MLILGTTAAAFALNAPEAYAAKQRMVTYVTSWAGYAHGQVRAKQSALMDHALLPLTTSLQYKWTDEVANKLTHVNVSSAEITAATTE